MIKASLPLATTIALVRKLVMVLETIEKLPVYLYDSSNGGYGLQILTRRLRFVYLEHKEYGYIVVVVETARSQNII